MNMYTGEPEIFHHFYYSINIDFPETHVSTETKANIHSVLRHTKICGTIFKTQAILKEIDISMQVYAHHISKGIDGESLKTRLFDEFKIKMPISKQSDI